MATRVQVRLLGGFAVAVDDRWRPASAWKHRRGTELVKLLALAPEHRLPRERIFEALWPELDPDASAANLHKAASMARRALGDRAGIVLAQGVVALWPDAEVVVDSASFEAQGHAALGQLDPRACRVAARAYTGELLPDDRYTEWTELARSSLRDLAIDLLRRAECWDRLVDLDAADERACVHAMRGHMHEARRHAAMRIYERHRAALSELGLAPSPEIIAILEECRRPPPVVAPVVSGSPLVGRQVELARLRAALRQALGGKGGAVLVTGEAGIGKTRVCETLLAEAAAGGCTTLRGSMSRSEGAIPYAPIAEALDRLLIERADLAAELSPTQRAAISRVLTCAPEPGGPSAAPLGRQQLFAAVTAVLEREAASRGVVVLLDDLQDADEATAQLLHYVARQAPFARVLLVCAFRSDARAVSVGRLRSSLIAQRLAHEVSLGPLSTAECCALAAEVAGRRLGAEESARIADLAGGNPFFVTELARAGTDVISPEISELLERRLRGLDEELLAVLQRVALLDVGFGYNDFVSASGLPEADADARLEQGLRHGIVVEHHDRILFSHGLLRDALLQRIPRHRRSLMHGEIAATFAAQRSDPVRVAHHLFEAGRPMDAVPWLGRAAQRAFGAGAYDDARMLVQRALVHAPDDPELWALRANVELMMGEPSAAVSFTTAIGHAAGPARTMLRISQAKALILSGDVRGAWAAIGDLAPSRSEELASLLAVRSMIAWCSGELAAAGDDADAARRLAIEHGLAPLLVDATMLQAMVAHGQGTWVDIVEHDLLATDRTPELAGLIHDGHLCVAESWLYGQRDYEEVVGFARRLRAQASEAGARRGILFADIVEGEARLLGGQLEPAEALLQGGRMLAAELHATGSEAMALQRMAELFGHRLDFDAARDSLSRALALARTSPFAMRHLLQRIFGTMIRFAPDREAARLALEQGELTIVGPAEGCQACAIAFAVPATIALARLGRLDRARRYLAQGEASAGAFSPPGSYWHASIVEARAELARADDQRLEARELFAAAAEMFGEQHPLDQDRCRAGT